MRVSIVGTGYVGLVSGACLAEMGHDVVCVDIDCEKTQAINAGKSPIYEDGLSEILKRNIGKRLSATTDLDTAVKDSELSIIAVGTPFDGDEIDLRFVKEVARQIGEALRGKEKYHSVVVKSTVVPGTTDELVAREVEAASGKMLNEDFGVGMNPEFLKEGEAVADFLSPDRIVMGCSDAKTQELLQELYSVFPQAEMIVTSCKTAEMIKYSANSLLATMISFANEIGNLCAELGDIDVLDVMRGVHLDKRLSPIEDGKRVKPGFTNYIMAGCGFGGSCFPKDVKALKAHGNARGLPMLLLDSVLQVNAKQPQQMLQMLMDGIPDLRDKRIAILGLAFKPGTDDMRESPAIPIVKELVQAGCRVHAYDPAAQEEAEKIFSSSIRYESSVAAAIANCDAIMVVTSWPEFADLPELIGDLSKQPLLIDGRRVVDKSKVHKYKGIGYRTQEFQPSELRRVA